MGFWNSVGSGLAKGAKAAVAGANALNEQNAEVRRLGMRYVQGNYSKQELQEKLNNSYSLTEKMAITYAMKEMGYR